MKPHPKIRKTIKWGGAVVTVLLVMVWAGSWWRSIELHRPGGKGYVVTDGSLWVYARGFMYNRPGLFWMGRWSDGHWLEWMRGSLSADWPVERHSIWPAVLVAAVVSACAWSLDTLARRRVRLNLCPKCNYDRAGIGVGVVCPECGARPSV